MTPEQAAYIAGFIDGEGTIGCARMKAKENRCGYRFSPYVSVANTEKSVLDWMASVAAHGYVTKAEGGPGSNFPHRKLCYRYRVRTSNIPDFLRLMRPYLRLKGRQADLVLDLFKIKGTNGGYSSYRAEEQHKIWNELRQLNRRGRPVEPIEFEGERDWIRAEPGECSVDGCFGIHYGKGLCRKHYRWKYESKTGESAFQRSCQICGIDISDERADAIYCGHKCRMKAYRRRKAA